ncbi:NAD(P)/FAD-dependent oxidoreductase [Methylomonas rapida]|uniref:FAD-dependent oxidoreductase n=1 Tax=Methylomonas rapida TaxID=2963939 RepID=A0ABY7GN02_9GAMM|nr:FAD-dependent oxidoreductase [Methylomonas rapida]WAR45884.1 FAD-dependent oxidoreductase [Methylomonas rapida]
MPLDALIVGQGLAGSLLAWELMRQQFSVMVVDNGIENASQVAAGLVNPVTGQRLAKSVDVDTLLPAALACYRQLAEQFGQEFFVALPMLRILQNAREQRVAAQRLQDVAYQAWLRWHADPVAGLNSPFGLLAQQNTGYLRTRPLLEALRKFLIEHDSYRQARFDYAELELQPVLGWRDLRPKHVVFCEGHRALDNPWFGQLPFQPAKGEILGCRAEIPCRQWLWNFGYWLIPQGQGEFRLGATFEPGKIDTLPSKEARVVLLRALAEVCPALRSVEVASHQAGVRPATLDKRPFVGPHPRYAHLHIFNGFGAKGSLAIPWHARRFADTLKAQTPLPLHSHVQRYDETYFPG